MTRRARRSRLDPQSVDPVPSFFDHMTGMIVRNVVDDDIRAFCISNNDIIRADVTISPNEIGQRRAFFPTDISIWSREHWRLHRVLMMDLTHRLRGEGLYLKDGHPYNTVFFAAKPFFVDTSSIVQEGDWKTFRKEMAFYHRLASVFGSGSHLPLRRELATRYQPSVRAALMRVVQGFLSTDPVVTRKERVRRLVRRSIDEQASNWTGYGQRITGEREYSAKDTFLRECIAATKSKTLVDLGCNIGRYAYLAAKEGVQVLAVDIDEVTVSRLTSRVAKEGLQITTAVADLPLLMLSRSRLPRVVRPTVDTVLAYSILHHLVHWQGYDFRRFFDELEPLQAKTVILEFVSYEDIYVSTWLPRRDWYSINVLIEIAGEFGFIAHVEEPHNKGRRLVLLRRKEPVESYS